MTLNWKFAKILLRSLGREFTLEKSMPNLPPSVNSEFLIPVVDCSDDRCINVYTWDMRVKSAGVSISVISRSYDNETLQRSGKCQLNLESRISSRSAPSLNTSLASLLSVIVTSSALVHLDGFLDECKGEAKQVEVWDRLARGTLSRGKKTREKWGPTDSSHTAVLYRTAWRDLICGGSMSLLHFVTREHWTWSFIFTVSILAILYTSWTSLS